MYPSDTHADTSASCPLATRIHFHNLIFVQTAREWLSTWPTESNDSVALIEGLHASLHLILIARVEDALLKSARWNFWQVGQIGGSLLLLHTSLDLVLGAGVQNAQVKLIQPLFYLR